MLLRQIFVDVCHTSSAAELHLSFADLDTVMYKLPRRAQPVLPMSPGEADSAVSSSHCAQLEDLISAEGLLTLDLRLSLRSWLLSRRSCRPTLTQRSKFCRRFIIGCLLLFVPFTDFTFPVCYVLMSRKTTKLYVKVFQKVQQLVPQFAPTCAMADFEEVPVAGFQHVYPDAGHGVGSTVRKQLLSTLLSGTTLSGLAISTHATWCRVVQSRKVNHTKLNFDALVMSGLAFSRPLSVCPVGHTTYVWSMEMCDSGGYVKNMWIFLTGLHSNLHDKIQA